MVAGWKGDRLGAGTEVFYTPIPDILRFLNCELYFVT